MASELTDDLRLSHAYLNTLSAGFQGAFVARRVFDQLGQPAPEWMHSLEDLKEALDWIGESVAAMFAGTPLLQRGVEPEQESGGAVALGFFALLRSDLTAMVASLLGALKLVRNANEQAAATMVVAAMARQAYAREHYTHAEVRFGEVFGLEDEADRWRQRTLSTQEDVRRAMHYLQRVTAEGIGDELLRWELWSEGAGLPGIFRTQLADMQSVDAYQKAREDYAFYGFSEADAESWRTAGVPPYSAALWTAYWFAPGDAAQWWTAGIANPSVAGAWRLRGFSLPDAQRWLDAGYGARDAALLRGAGYADPSMIPSEPA